MTSYVYLDMLHWRIIVRYSSLEVKTCLKKRDKVGQHGFISEEGPWRIKRCSARPITSLAGFS